MGSLLTCAARVASSCGDDVGARVVHAHEEEEAQWPPIGRVAGTRTLQKKLHGTCRRPRHSVGRLMNYSRSNTSQELLFAYMAENSTIESTQFFESLDAWQRCSD